MSRYYLYRAPNGKPTLLTQRLGGMMVDHMVLVSEHEEPPDIDGKMFDADNQLVDAVQLANYETRRALAYPAIGDQLDALWHAMSTGALPMIPAFFDPVQAVKDAHPKPENPA